MPNLSQISRLNEGHKKRNGIDSRFTTVSDFNRKPYLYTRLFHIFEQWVGTYFDDFLEDSKLTENLITFISQYVEHCPNDNIKRKGDLLKVSPQKKASNSSQNFQALIKNHVAPVNIELLSENSPHPLLPAYFSPKSFHITDIDPLEIARQLTLIDHRLLQKITPKEFLNQSWTKEKKESLAPGITQCTKRFNQISYWVATTVLKIKSSEHTRSGLLSRFIQIASVISFLLDYSDLTDLSELYYPQKLLIRGCNHFGSPNNTFIPAQENPRGTINFIFSGEKTFFFEAHSERAQGNIGEHDQFVFLC
jgi:hypothetical protein